MNKRLVCGAAVFAAFVVGGTSTAFAGEITGTGKVTPLSGKSECKYSGLEDYGGTPVPGTVQSFGNHPYPGTGVAQGNIPNSPGPAAPGTFCNPSDPQNEPS